MKNKIFSIVFCFIILLGMLVPILLPDNYYSTSEKRKLASFPQFSWRNLINGQLTEEINNYIADQFPKRDSWISLKSNIDITLGKTYSNGVFIGKDHYLIDMNQSLNYSQFSKNLEALKNFKELADAKHLPLYIMPVPTANMIMTNKLPALAVYADQSEIINQFVSEGFSVINTIEILKLHNVESIYYHTDHHWTSLGAYYAYQLWCNQHNKQVTSLNEYTKEVLCENFLGTTYNKVRLSNIPEEQIVAYYKTLNHTTNYNEGNYITDSIYERKFLLGNDQYSVFFNANQSITVVQGDGEDNLLIIKDSYANSFGQFVIDDYKETHMIDLRFYKGDLQKYIEENEISEILVLYNIPNMCSDTHLQFIDKL